MAALSGSVTSWTRARPHSAEQPAAGQPQGVGGDATRRAGPAPSRSPARPGSDPSPRRGRRAGRCTRRRRGRRSSATGRCRWPGRRRRPRRGGRARRRWAGGRGRAGDGAAGSSWWAMRTSGMSRSAASRRATDAVLQGVGRFREGRHVGTGPYSQSHAERIRRRSTTGSGARSAPGASGSTSTRSGVEVVLPRRAAAREAAAAVRELEPWIRRRLSEVAHAQQAVAARGDAVPYLGELLHVRAEPGRARVHRRGDVLWAPAGAERAAGAGALVSAGSARRDRAAAGSRVRAGRALLLQADDPRSADALGELLAHAAR